MDASKPAEKSSTQWLNRASAQAPGFTAPRCAMVLGPRQGDGSAPG